MPSLNPAGYPNLWQSSPTGPGGGGGGLLSVNSPVIVISLERNITQYTGGYIDFKLDNNWNQIKNDYYAQNKNLRGMEIYFKNFKDYSGNSLLNEDFNCWLAFIGQEQYMGMDSFSPTVSLCSLFVRPGQMLFIDDARLFGEIRGVLADIEGNQNLPPYYEAKFVVNAYFGN